MPNQTQTTGGPFGDPLPRQTTNQPAIIDRAIQLSYLDLDKQQTAAVLLHTDEIKRHGRQTLVSAVAMGRELAAAKDKIPHGKWLDYLSREFEMSESTAQRRINFAIPFKSVTVRDLPPGDLGAFDELYDPSFPEDVREKILADAHVSGERITKTVVKTTRELLHSSKSNEWYTPDHIIEAVRMVLGTIDLDPASCAEANETIQATKFYSQDDDGLSHDWQCSTMYLNPPYGLTEAHKSRQGIWTQRLLTEWEIGHLDAAICLINAATGDKWYQDFIAALPENTPVCLTRRLKFKKPGGGIGKSGTHGQAIVYLGPDPEEFCSVFAAFGPITYHNAPAPPAPEDDYTPRQYSDNVYTELIIDVFKIHYQRKLFAGEIRKHARLAARQHEKGFDKALAGLVERGSVVVEHLGNNRRSYSSPQEPVSKTTNRIPLSEMLTTSDQIIAIARENGSVTYRDLLAHKLDGNLVIELRKLVERGILLKDDQDVYRLPTPPVSPRPEGEGPGVRASDGTVTPPPPVPNRIVDETVHIDDRSLNTLEQLLSQQRGIERKLNMYSADDFKVACMLHNCGQQWRGKINLATGSNSRINAKLAQLDIVARNADLEVARIAQNAEVEHVIQSTYDDSKSKFAAATQALREGAK